MSTEGRATVTEEQRGLIRGLIRREELHGDQEAFRTANALHALLTTLEEREAEVERVKAAVPDPDKLEVLAQWFDREDASGRFGRGGTDVQDDLRRWAASARAALSPTPTEADDG